MLQVNEGRHYANRLVGLLSPCISSSSPSCFGTDRRLGQSDSLILLTRVLYCHHRWCRWLTPIICSTTVLLACCRCHVMFTWKSVTESKIIGRSATRNVANGCFFWERNSMTHVINMWFLIRRLTENQNSHRVFNNFVNGVIYGCVTHILIVDAESVMPHVKFYEFSTRNVKQEQSKKVKMIGQWTKRFLKCDHCAISCFMVTRKS